VRALSEAVSERSIIKMTSKEELKSSNNSIRRSQNKMLALLLKMLFLKSNLLILKIFLQSHPCLDSIQIPLAQLIRVIWKSSRKIFWKRSTKDYSKTLLSYKKNKTSLIHSMNLLAFCLKRELRTF